MSWSPHRRVLALLGATAASVVLLDRLTKAWAVDVMQPRIESGQGPIYVVDPVLRFTYTENSGAAFGFGAGYTWVFTIIAIIVGVVIIRFARTITSLSWGLALGGLLGGLLGNLIDRLTRPPSPGMGSVVDFIGLPNFPVFNIADMSITFSAIGMIVLAWRGVPVAEDDQHDERQAGQQDEQQDVTPEQRSP